MWRAMYVTAITKNTKEVKEERRMITVFSSLIFICKTVQAAFMSYFDEFCLKKLIQCDRAQGRDQDQMKTNKIPTSTIKNHSSAQNNLRPLLKVIAKIICPFWLGCKRGGMGVF